MLRPILSRRDWLKCALAVTGTTMVTGCGTIMYPERRGQPAGLIDWKIVALDGLGLLFFFIPGVIAFAVDFNNGTIYLPPDECADRRVKPRRSPLISRRIPPGKLSRSGLESLVAEHIHRPIDLTPGCYGTRKLKRLDEFWGTHDEFTEAA